MKRSLQLFSLLTCAAAIGCGQEVERIERRQTKTASLDAVPNSPVEFTFTLPDRATLRQQIPNIDEMITGYYYKIQGEGNNCPRSEVHEKSGVYDDGMLLKLTVQSSCNYLITVQIGEYSEPSGPAALKATTINFTDHIKPLLSEHCASCHPSYTVYSEAKAAGRAIVMSAENETMPPSRPLEDMSIAMLLSWADHNYPEIDLKAEAPSSLALKRILYRNNNNDYLQSYELFGRSSYELRRSLWLQPEGQAAGLSTNQLYTFYVGGL